MVNRPDATRSVTLRSALLLGFLGLGACGGGGSPPVPDPVMASVPLTSRLYYDDTPMHHLASRVTVHMPQTTGGIDFVLEEGGAISGRVTDSSGNPIPNVQIDVNDYDTGEGWGGNRTDSNGEYTITGLASGDYRVRACPSCVGPDEPRLNYRSEYYDNVIEYPAASRVSVAASQTAAGIDFQLEEGGSITGRVTSPAPTTPP